MADHFIKVVEDGTLIAEDGWAFAREERAGTLFFVVEKSSATDERKLNDAWHAAAQLVIEQAVREGIVQYVEPDEPPAN